MLFVRPSREQIVAEQVMLTSERQEMTRAHNAFATCEVAHKIGDGVEFAGNKFERRLIEHMDKGALGLHVADCERHEALGRRIGVAFTFHVSTNWEVAGRLIVIRAGFGSTERDRDLMYPPSLGRRKGEREFLPATN